ncbi:sperm-associated antigen 1 [Pygocentrus nattereri]|uniref:RNA-polymerase II-associated protein 3-like C-terminal domain-containing protein n=1 Tax=Pygocentrus nattereri TaxID=42514 RepID=A0A3B4EDW3_PYGNA|nr:sperm-associated antigen 1 [Pygocentrus nattereri]XP_017567843.1 sperm-associated antigen 1 [Pygocentrus nattereri]
MSTSTHSVPAEHLDYSYIEKCSDLKYLEKILRVLRSGKEGFYPHLTEFCEKHIEMLDPRSRALRKENSPATAANFSNDEWSQITNDLQRWEREIKVNELELKQRSTYSNDENIPPVRGSSCSLKKAAQDGVKNSLKTSPLPRTYQDWDKFDVEKECAKIEGSMANRDSPAIINDFLPEIKRDVNTTVLTEQEKVVLANREKDKGNEAFRACDYEEAVAYYSRSLCIIVTAAALNNRAQAEIKLHRWHDALSDCEQVLQLEPHNTKALLRRATVNKQLGNLQVASDDLSAVLRSEPHNMTAQRLLEEISKKINADMQDKPSKGKKLLIQEVDNDEDEVGDEDDKKPSADGGQSVGEDRQAAARGGMGNAQKKPQGRGPRGGTADKYKVKAEGGSAAEESRKSLANGSSSNCTTQPGTSRPDSPVGKRTESTSVAGALPPPLAQLKNEGNQLFKNGQFGDALEKYTHAITGFTEAGIDSPEDLSILYSNRAACYLKDGNSSDCIADCTRALELQPFSLKPLLRRAMAYESLERYHKAYVDYKTALQIDSNILAAHDSVNRITRLLIEQDGPDWRQKLPEIPVVPLSARQHCTEPPPSTHSHTEEDTKEADRRTEAHFTSLKTEGNELVKKGQYHGAVEKYSECLKLKSDECAIYTNRALCLIKLECFAEAKQDCDSALKLEPSNKKAFYRRALAYKGLKDYEACSSDLQEVLHLDASVQEAERELAEVTALLKQHRATESSSQPRRNITITEEEEEEEEEGKAAVSSPEREKKSVSQSINLQPSNAYEFGQALNAACSHNDTAAGAQLLRCVPPDSLPQYLKTQLDAHTLSFIMQTLDTHLLTPEPGLVYQLLSHLHTTERFSVVLMLLDSDERRKMTHLFEHLGSVDSELFSQNDVKNLANKYI